MKIHTGFEQNSLEWLVARAGLVTASEIDALVSPKWEIRKGLGVKSYLAKKVVEKWLQGPVPGDMTLEMEYGKILEEECLPWLEFEYGWKISRPAMISTDDGKCACSPDGWLAEQSIGVEIKCPMPVNHVKYLLDNKIPDDYVGQVQFSLWVTGAKEWKFVSYRRGFPNLVLSAAPIPEAQEAISESVKTFLPCLDDAFDRLVALNGGTPPKLNTLRESLMRAPDVQDEIHDYRH